jgi:hypothetical protein
MVALQQPKRNLAVLGEPLERIAGVRRSTQDGIGVLHPESARLLPSGETALNLIGVEHTSAVNQVFGCRFGFWWWVWHLDIQSVSR